MKAYLVGFWHADKGATSIEYAIIAAGVAVVIVSAVNGVGASVNGLFNAVLTALK
jgi:pilus assembly protein Flp/PilA